ncbi:carboxypeptidase regulatory-like domain-containing protein, partial [Myxococcota bacterium]|nr:carboxypeptidase regulatory-like domain-containing protein [Myxococcota bacterium]
MKTTLRLIVIWTLTIFAAACTSEVQRDNPYDANSPGPKVPGRIIGGVDIVDGSSVGLSIYVYDNEGVRVDNDVVTTGDDGAFMTGELPPASYALEVAVPPGNYPIYISDIELLPGQERDLGRLVSLPEPPTGQIFGAVKLTDSAVGPSNIRVVATRLSAEYTQTIVTYTDSTGAYSFSALTAGLYDIRADKEGFTPDIVSLSLQSSTRAIAEAEMLQLHPATAVTRFEVEQNDGTLLAGAPFTALRDVNLLLLAFRANEFRYSENADFIENEIEVVWQDHVAQKSVTLSEGEGTKTIYTQFRLVDDESGRERLRTEIYTASIILDETAPEVVAIVLAPDAKEVGAQRFYTGDSTSVPLVIDGYDALSKIRRYMVLPDGVDPGTRTWSYAAAGDSLITIYELRDVGSADGIKTVGVILEDAAGNESIIYTDEVIIDTAGPVAQTIGADTGIQIEAGATLINRTQVTVDLQATDALSGVSEFKLSFGDACSGGVWQSYEDGNDDLVITTSTTLNPADGLAQFLSVRFKDGAGNMSADCSTAQISVDTVGPSSALISVASDAAATDPNT